MKRILRIEAYRVILRILFAPDVALSLPSDIKRRIPDHGAEQDDREADRDAQQYNAIKTERRIDARVG